MLMQKARKRLRALILLEEQRQLLKEDYIVTVGSIAFGKGSTLAYNVAACIFDQLAKSVKGLTCGDNIINDENSLALEVLSFVAVKIKLLLNSGGDGLNGYTYRVLHVKLDHFACNYVLHAVAKLSCHFVAKRNTLGLGSYNNIALGDLLNEITGTGNSQLHIRKHDKSCNIKVLIYRADR